MIIARSWFQNKFPDDFQIIFLIKEPTLLYCPKNLLP